MQSIPLAKRMAAFSVVIAFISLLALDAVSQTTSTGAGKNTQPPPPQKIRTFSSPEEAANALVAAAEKYDVKALYEILGPEGKQIIETGEPARDKEQAMAFAAQAREKMSVDKKTQYSSRGRHSNRTATLIVGKEDWPFPVPIIRRDQKWSFFTTVGIRELLLRRIGRNELDAIEACRIYVEAQHDYALLKREGTGVNQYAQRIIATPGKQDGLAWQNADGTWGGPLGPNIAAAVERGYTNRNEPFHGYFFKVLTGQGPSAPLGEMNWIVKGMMIGGFALIATPAQYRLTGVKSFIVSYDGVVYEKDLGPNSVQIGRATERFNPDATWRPVADQ
jgi:hypothetical protein